MAKIRLDPIARAIINSWENQFAHALMSKQHLPQPITTRFRVLTTQELEVTVDCAEPIEGLDPVKGKIAPHLWSDA